MSAPFDTRRIRGPANGGTLIATAELLQSPAAVKARLEGTDSLLDATHDALGNSETPEIARLMVSCAADHAAVRGAVIDALEAGREVRIDCHLLEDVPTESLAGIHLHTADDETKDALVVHVQPSVQ
jgi:hypothetical protein